MKNGLKRGLLLTLVTVLLVSTTAITASAVMKRTVKKQKYVTKTSIANKKASKVKKGTTNLVISNGKGYIKFVAPTTKVYSFTFSNVKTKSKSPGHTAACIQLPNESDGKTMWPKDVKQKGGKYCFLRLTKNGAQNDRTGMVINRYLKSRTGTIKLEAGQTIYFHFDESERTTAKLVIK